MSDLPKDIEERFYKHFEWAKGEIIIMDKKGIEAFKEFLARELKLNEEVRKVQEGEVIK